MVSSMTYLNLKNTGTHDGGIVMLIAKIRKNHHGLHVKFLNTNVFIELWQQAIHLYCSKGIVSIISGKKLRCTQNNLKLCWQPSDNLDGY
jgi:hypothetical protein